VRWIVVISSFALIVLLTGAGVAAAQDTTGTGAVRGSVQSAALQPVGDVAVCLPEIGRCVVTDGSGRFVITDVRAGRYRLEIITTGQTPLDATIDVRAGLDTAVEVVLPNTSGLTETVTVSAPAFVAAEEIKNSAFLVSSSDILRSAGALQDVSRYVQTLPGVVIGANDFRNDLIVRGGSPLENLYIVDNIEIPNINTFANFASAGGTVSILDAQLIQDVTFLTGAFPASYGNRTSSVLQTSLREGNRDRVAGRATVGFAGAGAVLEGPIGDARGSWIVSARRSFLDLVTDDIGIGGVPVQYTFNAKAVLDLNAANRIWLLNVTGVDNIRLGLTEDTDLTEELSNFDIRYDGWRSATGINWQQTFGRKGVGLFGVTHSRARVEQRVADLVRNGIPPPDTSVEDQLSRGETVFREDSGESETTVKYDFTAYVPVAEKVQAGISIKRFGIDYDAASPFGSDSPYFTAPDQNPFALQSRETTYQYAAYAQGSRRVGERVGVTLGGRVDRYAFLSATTFSPRAGISYEVNNALSLRASAGRHYQQPFFLFLTAFPGNRTLQPFRADHVVFGVDVSGGDAMRMTVEYYEKRYKDYPVSSDIASLSLANIGDTFAVREILFPLVSAGRGRARGIEISVESRPRPGTPVFGQINVAVSRARHAGSDRVLRPGSFDYPVVLNALAGYRLGRWDFSVRGAYLSGRPFTPFDDDLSTEQRRAVYDLSRVNEGRAPDYLRLDVRVDRGFVVNRQPVTLFFGIQNVTNRKNVSGYSWNRRLNSSSTLDQQGIFPILGLDWQF
jgi:hypothetical protein